VASPVQGGHRGGLAFGPRQAWPGRHHNGAGRYSGSGGLVPAGARPAPSHRAADGVTVTGRPAHEGRIDHGSDCSAPVGTTTSGRSPVVPATGPSSSWSSRRAASVSSIRAAVLLAAAD
jgi:hypothetical protein